MALQNDIYLDTGIKVSYWKISMMAVSPSNKICDFKIAGYLTKEARDNDKDCIETFVRRVEQDMYDKYFSEEKLSEYGNTGIKSCYRYLKDNDKDFMGSIDI